MYSLLIEQLFGLLEMNHSLRQLGMQLCLEWHSMLSVRPELCGDYSFEQPKTALCGDTVA